MLTGFEALGAASALLQVISFATDVVVACKNAYDGVTTSQDDLQRYAGQMSEAVGRVHTRCEQMRNANSKSASPKLQSVAKECKDAADKLDAEVQCVTSMQAQGDILKSIRKTFRASRHRKKLQALQESLSTYQQVVNIELTSHLCTQNDAIVFQQDTWFGKLDTDVQFLINQLAQGINDVKDLVRREHVATRNAITQEGARAEAAINSHTDSQVLELRTTAETKRKCETFLKSLKAPRMNQRYNDIMDSKDASFNQVFATYEDMIDMYGEDSEESGYLTDNYESENDDNSEDEDDSGDNDDPQDEDGPEDDDDTEEIDSESYESSEGSSDPGYMSDMGDMDNIYNSWFRFNSWLKSDDKLFYIQGKPGSGKSTLVKFILNQDQTRDFIQEWSPNATIISYFFWKIGSEEQNSIKGLWCSLLYQRLQNQQQLILDALQHFSHLSLYSDYHDWSIKDLQDIWIYLARLDTRHICIFIDGLDEIRNRDGFYKLAQSIHLISQLPRIKLCVSARPEAQIVRWLQTTNAVGILLEDLTKLDMLQFVRDRLREVLPNNQVSVISSQKLRHELVDKAQGVFLWLHLATRSIIEGIENMDSENMLFARLKALPGDLENLYIDMWRRMNANSPVYVETARRYFRYILHHSGESMLIFGGRYWNLYSQPWLLQIACAENPAIREKLLKSTGRIELTEVLRMCEYTKASVQSRCAGLLEVRPHKAAQPRLFERLEDNSNALGHVAFIHRTAHDFLTDKEAGQSILGCGPLSDFSSETQLLKGRICIAIALASECPLSPTHSNIVNEIAEFAKRWGSESLPLATEMLDIVRPLYDRRSIISWGGPWGPFDPFLSLLTTYDIFDDFVISGLATETSTGVVTSVLRQGWTSDLNTRSFRKLSKRLFFALIKLGADPHEYGTLFGRQLEPFVARETAFTNLLVSFINSSKCCKVEHRIRIEDEPQRKELLETLEIAIYMATTCRNLNTVTSLFSCIPETGPMMMVPFEKVIGVLGDHTSYYVSMIHEVNIQFLLLYLLSRIGGSLADCVLAVPQAQAVLSRIDRPLVKIRYIQLPLTEKNMPEPHMSSQLTTFQRILSPQPLPITDIEQLFGVDFDGLSQDLRQPHEDKTDLNTIAQYIKDVETQEVNFEDIVTSLATENMGYVTYEEAGINPPYEYLRSIRETGVPHWRIFPLAMGRLQAAAAMRKEWEVTSDSHLMM